MERRAATITVLISASILSAPALADGLARHRSTDAHLCKRLEASLKHCERVGASRGACDSIEQTLDKVCGAPDVIYASRAAEGRLLDRLAEDFDIVPIEEAPSALMQRPVLLGPGDLDDPDAVRRAFDAHQAGMTVGIVHAVQGDVDRFHGLIRGGPFASCQAAEGASEIPLYALQQTITRIPQQDSSYCMQSLGDPFGGDSREFSGEWLRRRFADAPPAPPPSIAKAPSVASQGSTNLDELAKAIHCSYVGVTGSGELTTSADTFVRSLRDFDGEEDWYDGIGEFSYIVTGSGASANSVTANIRAPREEVVGDIQGTSLLFTEPDTTNEAVTSYTNSKSTTVSGSVGYSATDGPSVSASASTTVGQSISVTVPPTIVANMSNPATAEASWRFIPQNGVLANQLFSVATGWLWIIPRDGYPDGGVGAGGINYVIDTAIPGFSLCSVPFPFPEWTITAPLITSLIPDATTAGGGTFNIRGQRMYPGIVADVLLGGEALPQSNYQVISEHEIRVTVPSDVAPGKHPVQVITEFEGKRLPSNADVQIEISRRAPLPNGDLALTEPGSDQRF